MTVSVPRSMRWQLKGTEVIKVRQSFCLALPCLGVLEAHSLVLRLAASERDG